MGKKITLIKAAQVPVRGPIRPSGFTAVVDDDTYEALLSRGVIATEVEPEPVQEITPEVKIEAVAQPVAEAAHVVASSVQLPPMTAPINVWREIAAEVGIKTANMKKAEIIGAMKQHLNQ